MGAAMARFQYDRSSKWLIQHHGDSILRLAGVDDVITWRPLQAEIVQPRKLPDGLLEVQRSGQTGTLLYILELVTYSDTRVPEQILDDVALVYQDRRVLPEVLVLVLHPKGNVRVADSLEMQSPGGWTRWRLHWRVVELWTLSAENLLALRNPGLIPWATLARFNGPADSLLQQCRAIIEEKADPNEHDNLLAVTQVLAGLRYNNPQLLGIFGGKEAMIESPVLQELIAEKIAESAQRLILSLLGDQFGNVPTDISVTLKAITNEDRLKQVIKAAARCPSLEDFRQQMSGPDTNGAKP